MDPEDSLRARAAQWGLLPEHDLACCSTDTGRLAGQEVMLHVRLERAWHLIEAARESGAEYEEAEAKVLVILEVYKLTHNRRVEEARTREEEDRALAALEVAARPRAGVTLEVPSLGGPIVDLGAYLDSLPADLARLRSPRADRGRTGRRAWLSAARRVLEATGGAARQARPAGGILK